MPVRSKDIARAIYRCPDYGKAALLLWKCNGKSIVRQTAAAGMRCRPLRLMKTETDRTRTEPPQPGPPAPPEPERPKPQPPQPEIPPSGPEEPHLPSPGPEPLPTPVPGPTDPAVPRPVFTAGSIASYSREQVGERNLVFAGFGFAPVATATDSP